VPIAIVVAALAPIFVAESRVRPTGRRTFDVAGALLSTAGLLAIVLGVIRAEPLGWSSFEVVALLVGGVALLGAFIRVEQRSAAPLVPLGMFRSRGLSTSIVALALNGAAFLAMFFLTAIFLQQVRGLTALETGLQFLPMGVAAIASAVIAAQLVTRLGTRPVQIAGGALSVVGLLLLSQADATSSYAATVLPGLILFGVGIIAVGTPAQIAAVADVKHEVAGAASGVVNAGYQVGGALGLAVITTVATSHVESLVAGGTAAQDALVGGFERGLLVAAVFAVANLLMALGAPRVRPTAEQLVEAAVAA
jgi:predicted MFS family arabinose efflux permease